jgi:hypothetical protein
MAINYTTVASMNSLFNDIYEDAIFVTRESALMPSLVTNYTAQGVATRHLGIYPQASAVQVAEMAAFARPVEWTKTELASITPSTKMTQVIISDERLATDPQDAARDAASEMGGAMATKIDTDLLALMSSFDTDLGTAGSALTIKRVAAGIAILRNSSVPNPLSAVMHPYGWFDVWVELGQPEANKALLGDVANQALRDYFTGNWLGVNWFVSSNIATDDSDDAVSGVFHRDAIALDTRRGITLEPDRDPDRRAWKLNMHAWYGQAVRRSGHGVALTHDATTPTGV